MKAPVRTIVWHDELNDEFSEAVIQAKKIDKDYDYEGKPMNPFLRAFWYRIVAIPLGKLFLFFKYRHRVIYRDGAKPVKGAVLYGNHTNPIADALIPTIVNRLISTFVIVHPDNVSMPFLGRVTPYMGAVPLAEDFEGTKHMNTCLKHLHEKNRNIVIYPEAHIWPFYTKIRPFTDASFGYPVSMNAPVYSFVNTYHKRLFSKNPKIITYVDGPFYPPVEGSVPAKRRALRNEVYEAMVRESKNNTLELIHYVKGTENDG